MGSEPQVVQLAGNNLTLEDVKLIAQNGACVEIPEPIRNTIAQNRRDLLEQVKTRPEISIYGTNRLHGNLKDEVLSLDRIDQYQVKYINVHNCGTGPELPIEVVRAMLVIRLNSFAKTKSGMRLETCQLMVDMLNRGVTPVVREEGSVGASGDLVPLAMIGATMIGLNEAEAYHGTEKLTATTALERAGLSPITLGAKEAMGLTNGSNFIAAIASLACLEADDLLLHASATTALSLEAIRGEKKAFQRLVNEDSDRHEGQIFIANQIRKLIQGSQRMSKAAQEAGFKSMDAQIHPSINRERVQDRYSFRAAPHVQGAAHEAVQHLRRTLQVEINSATDNPLFDFDCVDESKGIKFASGANFHGQALATVIDYLKIALTSVGLVSDKRSFCLLSRELSYGLPSNLAFDTEAGDGGLMIAQYCGSCEGGRKSRVVNPRVDHVHFYGRQSRRLRFDGEHRRYSLRKIIDNLRTILAIEYLCALRAIQLTYDLLPKTCQSLGGGTSKIYEFLCQQPGWEPRPENWTDHYLGRDIDQMLELMRSGELKQVIDV